MVNCRRNRRLAGRTIDVWTVDLASWVNIIVGIVGAMLGGFIFSRFMEGQTVNLLGSIAVALVGAIIVIIIVRVVMPGRGSAF